MVVKALILTCQVLILTPFVVSLRKAVSNTTFVTMPVELSFPKLPMLRNTISQQRNKEKGILRHWSGFGAWNKSNGAKWNENFCKYLIPCPGPHDIPFILMPELALTMEMQSSPAYKWQNHFQSILLSASCVKVNKMKVKMKTCWNLAVLNYNISWLSDVDPVGIRAISWSWDSNLCNSNSLRSCNDEMHLLAVLNSKAFYSYIWTWVNG